MTAKVERILALAGDQELGVPPRPQDLPRGLEEAAKPELSPAGPAVPTTGIFRPSIAGRPAGARSPGRSR